MSCHRSPIQAQAYIALEAANPFLDINAGSGVKLENGLVLAIAAALHLCTCSIR